MREEWRSGCWPVPPETGWTFLKAERSQPRSGLDAATPVWEGEGHRRAEREQPEMAVCFGADLPGRSLIDGRFSALAEAVHGPVQEALRRR